MRLVNKYLVFGRLGFKKYITYLLHPRCFLSML